MATAKCIDQATVKQVGALFMENAMKCNAALQLCRADLDDDQQDALLEVMRDTICCMGWMADVGSRKLGGVMVVGKSAEEWMLCPRYHSAAVATARE